MNIRYICIGCGQAPVRAASGFLECSNCAPEKECLRDARAAQWNPAHAEQNIATERSPFSASLRAEDYR